MRFRSKLVHRNTSKLCDITFPYAGATGKRGKMVKGGHWSDELPSDRFFDPLLQRDWKNGHIEVSFNSNDRAILGDSIEGLVEEPVSDIFEPTQPTADGIAKGDTPKDKQANDKPEKDKQSNDKPEKDKQANDKPEKDKQSNDKPEKDKQANDKPAVRTTRKTKRTRKEIKDVVDKPIDDTGQVKLPEVDGNDRTGVPELADIPTEKLAPGISIADLQQQNLKG